MTKESRRPHFSREEWGFVVFELRYVVLSGSHLITCWELALGGQDGL
jgi:hypothetical protein